MKENPIKLLDEEAVKGLSSTAATWFPKDFDVDKFVIDCRKKVPLETLRDDLGIYLKILKSAMIELINKDYADFVNLSTNLVGMDKAISNLTVPLGQLREEVLSVRTAMHGAMVAVEEKMKQKKEIQQKKRIANITTTLQYSLEGSFLEGLEQEDVAMLRQCLRTYALIDKIHDAENLFRQHIVKPYMEEVISESFLRSCNQGLEGMFAKVLEFVPTHCSTLRKITCPSSGFQEIAGALETALVTGLNTTTNDGLWKLQAFSTLWSGLERCWHDDVYVPALVHRFWKLTLQQLSRHTLWLDQLYEEEMEHRSQILASKPSRNTLTSSYSTSQLSSLGAGDSGSSQSPVPRSSSPQPQHHQEAVTTKQPITIGQIVFLLCDSCSLQAKLSVMYEQTVHPKILAAGLQNDAVLKECLQESMLSLEEHLPKFCAIITDEIQMQCSAFIRQVSDIPRLYRRTNREAPSKPSGYLSGMLRPLQSFCEEYSKTLEPKHHSHILNVIFSSLIDQFSEVTSEVLTSVKRMEESLKRLKKVRGSERSSSNQGLSDDDKIRQQIILDIEELGKKVEHLVLIPAPFQASPNFRVWLKRLKQK
ncbi:hypothetical protein C0Q70_14367 [Pomacea canaliculata]|uniref:Conserved oligomeric Golgi complex subunit 2 n=1 Tax=Pomacea canaliculata TaxID=400727 RepID=A0A2T7NZV0_POMCA|nr:hypothetical protein C0Q70_14367 [Pomacea canaliculata]